MYCLRSQIGLDPREPTKSLPGLEMARERRKASSRGSGSIVRSAPRPPPVSPFLRCFAAKRARADGSRRREIWCHVVPGADLGSPLGQPHLPCMSNANRIKSAVRGMPSFPLMTVHELAIVL
jgi:hypothetical protein